ncbi:MAG TPA: RNA polymerase sigma factor [Terracidiphilus sp.]|nr:RNA polymerase sigma factor [Terracidiphilus sp.]
MGTLSWSGMGLAWPDKHRRDESPSPRTAAPTRRPDFNVRQSDTGAPSPRQIPGGNPIAKGRVQASSDLAPATLPKHAEAASLEIDWSQIVRRCLDGDSSAWAELVRAQHRRVYGLCYRFTGNPTDAEDLTQDVFLKIYSNLASFDTGRGSLHVWIAAMTRNLLVDNFRRTKNLRATSSLDDGWESAEELKPIDRLTARGASPHEAAAKKELAKMVQEALSRVSVELREAVILRDLQDLDYKEIACVLDIPEGTVKSRISRGRAELARLLERNRREVM